MNNSQIKWRILKALNALYENRKTPSTILSDGFVDYLTHTRRLLRRKLSNANYLEPCNGFAAYYEKNFKTDFQNAEQFLSAAGLEHDARRSYTLNDINTLQFIAANKSELQQSLTTLRTFSSRVFTYGGSKYLETHRSLLEAVYQLLEIEQFPAEDPKILQWRFVVDCPDARHIVLCENLNFLKTPRIARDNHIELWYVGGNNISNIDYIPDHKLTLPLYYSCDWDYDGLKEALGDKLGACQLPTVTINGEAKSLKSFAGSKVAGVNPNSKNPKVAMQFAAFLASTDGQLLRYQVRSAIPVATALAEDPAIASDIVATAILDTIANTSLLQPSLPEMANWWVPIETLGRNIVAGKVTAENGADSLAQTLDLINNPAL